MVPRSGRHRLGCLDYDSVHEDMFLADGTSLIKLSIPGSKAFGLAGHGDGVKHCLALSCSSASQIHLLLHTCSVLAVFFDGQVPQATTGPWPVPWP